MTKLDILTGIPELKIGVKYTLKGKEINYMPGDIDEFGAVKVEYETLKGWKEDISKITDYKKLPSEAKTFVERVEKLTGIDISWVGVGPEREACILRKWSNKNV